jgi:hypothetical protein
MFDAALAKHRGKVTETFIPAATAIISVDATTCGIRRSSGATLLFDGLHSCSRARLSGAVQKWADQIDDGCA